MKRLVWLYRAPAVSFASLLLIAGAGFGSTNAIGAFLLSIPVLGLLGLITLIATIWGAALKAQRTRAAFALVLICATPLAYHLSYGVVQRVKFLNWAQEHSGRLEQASRRDGIIQGWDSWGFAGEDTFSYLVVDTQDRLRSKVRAKQWTKQIGQSCDLWRAQRMRPNIYIATTYTNCPYDGVEPAE